MDEVIVYCVNDGAVMNAWANDQNVAGNDLITFMGDPTCTLTKAFDMELTHPGPASVGIIGRCKRHAAFVVDGVVKSMQVSEAADDPAGDSFPEGTCAPAMLEVVAAAK